MIWYHFERRPDPRKDWLWCPSVDLSATARSGICCRREIIRCLKRYVAREIYRLIAPIRTTACPAQPNGTAS